MQFIQFCPFPMPTLFLYYNNLSQIGRNGSNVVNRRCGIQHPLLICYNGTYLI